MDSNSHAGEEMREPGSQASMDSYVEAWLVDELLKEQELSYAVLFGSFAEGYARSDSDIDIAVRWRLADSDARLKFSARLSGRLSLAANRLVDIVDIAEAPLDIAYTALTEGRPLVIKDQQAYLRDKTYYTCMYLDIRPLLQTYYRALRDRLLAGKAST